jgi:5-oxopent-3-ene-1,2,5-tricarboxylate decarboxylase / 2-hydroxyhepta-2,4-diene-1,7-dioate isomerase
MQLAHNLAIAQVYGVALNHRQDLERLGDSVNQLPYKSPALAPVLYLKPKNTWIEPTGTAYVCANADGEMVVRAGLAIVVGAHLKNATAIQAKAGIYGYTQALDFCIRHTNFYRPSVRLIARDATLAIGNNIILANNGLEPDLLKIELSINGKLVHNTGNNDLVRGSTQLLVDISHFMSLYPGDVVLLGSPFESPVVKVSDIVSVSIDCMGTLTLPPLLPESEIQFS